MRNLYFEFNVIVLYLRYVIVAFIDRPRHAREVLELAVYYVYYVRQNTLFILATALNFTSF